ncbi:MAG TPA: hypothetical protein PLQ76_00435 [bacterium]|nr:hypothetical protein [bacterium]
MSLKIDDVKKVLATFEHLEKKGKAKLSDIDRMEGCFADLFPKDKSSVDIVKENRKKIFNP